jgi:AcrR family transcriptional regulator
VARIHTSDTDPDAGTAPTPVATSAARGRIVEAADELFYSVGIRSVGVDRVITKAGVARVTFFRHFPTKDDLVCNFLSRRAASARAELTALHEANSGNPRAVLTFMARAPEAERRRSGFRGCEFVNTAAEFGDPDHPARSIVTAHRAWMRDFLADLLTELDHPRPARTAEVLLMLRTGAVIAASLEDAHGDGAAFEAAWDGLIDSR